MTMIFSSPVKMRRMAHGHLTKPGNFGGPSAPAL
jgi:hypothetical protein